MKIIPRKYGFSKLYERQGSILLLVVIIAGFMLVVFVAISNTMRNQLTSQLDASSVIEEIGNEIERVRITKEVFSGSKIQSSSRFEVAKRGGLISVFSGTGTSIYWSGTGEISLQKDIPESGRFCYDDRSNIGISIASGCTSTGIIFDKTAGGTGTVILTTSGGYVRINPIGTSSGISLGIPVYYEVSAAAGNILVPIERFKIDY